MQIRSGPVRVLFFALEDFKGKRVINCALVAGGRVVHHLRPSDGAGAFRTPPGAAHEQLWNTNKAMQRTAGSLAIYT